MNRRNKMLAQRDVLRAKNRDLLQQISNIKMEIDAPSTDPALRWMLKSLHDELTAEHHALTAEIADLIEKIPYPRKRRAKRIMEYYIWKAQVRYATRVMIAEILTVLRDRKK